MAFRFVLLILPSFVIANIDVTIHGDIKGNVSNLTIYVHGDDVGIITDTERATFNLSDSNLKDAVKSSFGKRPDGAYLKNPTSWGDLYKKYGGHEVTRTSSLLRGMVINTSVQYFIILVQVFENNSSEPTTIDVGITKEVQNKVSSTWTTEGDLSVNTNISYDMDLRVFETGGKISLHHFSSWGNNTERSETAIVGATSPMEIVVEPGQFMVAQLNVTRGSMQLEMEYETWLSGDIALNYADMYMDKYFWLHNIELCMTKAGLSNKMLTREFIDIEFYAGATVNVFDKTLTKKVMEKAF